MSVPQTHPGGLDRTSENDFLTNEFIDKFKGEGMDYNGGDLPRIPVACTRRQVGADPLRHSNQSN